MEIQPGNDRSRPIRAIVRVLVATALLLTLASGASPTQAQETGPSIELFGGWFSPQPFGGGLGSVAADAVANEEGDLDGDVTYGIRAGYRFSESHAAELSVSRLEPDIDPIGNVSFDVELTFLDLSYKWYAKRGGRTQVALFAGPGLFQVDVTGRLFLGDVQVGETNVSDEFVTAHAGVASEIRLGEHVYLRPDTRFRWIEDASTVTAESSLALGFRF